MDVARLKSGSVQDFDIAPGAPEVKALTKLFNALKLTKMRFKGTLQPFGKSELELTGHLGATVVQPCVVTLAPVTTRIETDIHRLFVNAIGVADAVDIDPNDDVDLELLGPTIDLGLIAIEELALALPEYPRAPGAELALAFNDDIDDPDSAARPFDALKALRDRLSGD